MSEASLRERQQAALRIWLMIVAICVLILVIVNLVFMVQHGFFNNGWHNLPPPSYEIERQQYQKMTC